MCRRHPRAATVTDPLELSLPFEGRWLVQNSPARRVPSHGTDLFASRFAIDFVGVTHGRRTARRIDWRTVLATESPDRFVSFGRPILAPVDGVVVHVHDGEPDHAARRSQLTLVPYALGQGARARAGVHAIAGNHVVIAADRALGFVALVHLQAGSIGVRVGDHLTVGRPVARCGNSGNSTQPHLHLQAMDGPDPARARALPVAFRDFRQWQRGSRHPEDISRGVPPERAVVEPWPVDPWPSRPQTRPHTGPPTG
jgi:murein DD-endopeptidase MepM/ murein hydrolase activator NlpD